MYRLPRDEFPVRANTRLHSALTGWQATVFYRTPSTKEEKLDSDGGLPRLLLYKQTDKCQTNSRFAETCTPVSKVDMLPLK